MSAPAATLAARPAPAAPSAAGSPTRGLGIAGWSHLDPLLVAALALEAPVLLIGPHGTAKTLVAERVARAVGSPFRHYNASLINYDDLVGIPVPTDEGTLRFVGTEGAVWGAGFVFFDEVNRCRADLQNKLFPIVHERRIGGVDLTDLVHRWAAMNPSSAGEAIGGYVGTEPLDTALADRFWFVVATPSWRDLDPAERVALVEGDDVDPTAAPIADVVARTGVLLDDVEAELGERTTRYVIALVDVLAQGGVELSPRRARILRRTLVATAAAVRALGRPEDLAATFELVLRNGLAQWADVEPPELARIVAAHVQAFDLASATDDLQARLLAERDPVRRVRLAVELGAPDGTVAAAVTSALATRPTDGERSALAAVLRFGLAEQRLTPGAWSAIHQGSARIVDPGEHIEQVAPGRQLDAWRRAVQWLERRPRTPLEQAIVNGLGPEGVADLDVGDLMKQVERWVKWFGVRL